MTTLEAQIQPYKAMYPPSMVEAFLDYWDEPNAKGKAKWQLEKTWEVGRRLRRWQKNNEKWDYERSQRFIKVNETPREDRGNRIDVGMTRLFD